MPFSENLAPPSLRARYATDICLIIFTLVLFNNAEFDLMCARTEQLLELCKII